MQISLYRQNHRATRLHETNPALLVHLGKDVPVVQGLVSTVRLGPRGQQRQGSTLRQEPPQNTKKAAPKEEGYCTLVECKFQLKRANYL